MNDTLLENEEVKTEEAKKEIPLITEELFWDEGSPQWELKTGIPRSFVDAFAGDFTVDLDMERDSYVWGYTGPRGSGKTTFMTYMAMKAQYLYPDKKIFSNYPIEYKLYHRGGYVTYHKAEVLDIYQMLQFDEKYKHAIILLDEAPMVINRLAAMTWKNRLIDIFLQLLRKDRNSFFYCSQNFRWVDNEVRWQTDLLTSCRDASRRYKGVERGTVIMADTIDHSGIWTGYTYEEQPVTYPLTLDGTDRIWNCFDSYLHFDVMESLRKVELQTQSYKVGEQQQLKDNITCANRLLVEVENAYNSAKQIADKRMIFARLNVSDKEKKSVMNILRGAGAFECGGGMMYLNFSNFDPGKFSQLLSERGITVGHDFVNAGDTK